MNINCMNLLIVTVSALFVGCRANTDSDLKIDSGKHITYASKTHARGVVRINGCTATIVSDNTIISAAHCLKKTNRNVCIMSGEYSVSGLCTDKIFYPNELSLHRNGGPHDVFYAVFPRGSFSEFHELDTDEVSVGDKVHMVGYSNWQNTIESEEVSRTSPKRWGENIITSVTGDDKNTILTEYGSSSSKVAISPGDSGGPLLKNCKLIGTASRMILLETKSSLHTNLVGDKFNVGFLKTATDVGGYICGLHGRDESRCVKDNLAIPTPGLGDDFPCESKNPTRKKSSEDQKEERQKDENANEVSTSCVGENDVLLNQKAQSEAYNSLMSTFEQSGSCTNFHQIKESVLKSLEMEIAPQTERDECVMSGRLTGFFRAESKINIQCTNEAIALGRKNALNAAREVCDMNVQWPVSIMYDKVTIHVCNFALKDLVVAHCPEKEDSQLYINKSEKYCGEYLKIKK